MTLEKESGLPVQGELESLMAGFVSEGRWELMALFSADGLPMAGAGDSALYPQERLLEFAFAQIETVRMLESDMAVTEITIQASKDTILVFRYFKGWEENLVLAAVANRRKGYRRAMNDIIRRIQKL
jgi:hypothetical protein